MDAPGDGEAEAATQTLPRDVLAAVFARLGLLDRLRAASACRRWRSVAVDASPLTHIVLTVAGDVLDGAAFRADLRGRLASLRGELTKEHLPAYEAELRAELELLQHAAREGVSTRSAAELLRRPECAAARSLELRCFCAGKRPSDPLDLDSLHLWRAVLAAPESIASLDVLLPSEPTWPSSSLEHVAAALRLREAPFADRLRELSIRYERLVQPPVFARMGEPRRMPRLKALECLGAVIHMGALAQSLESVPLLGRVHSLELPSGRSIAAAAAAGLRCAVLFTSDASAAAFSLLSPAAFEGVPWARPCSLTVVFCEAVPPEVEFGDQSLQLDGVREVVLEGCPLRPAALRALAGIPTLRDLWLKRCHVKGSRPGAPHPPAAASPADLAAALAGVPPLCTVHLWPKEYWSIAEASAFLDAARRYPSLLRALDAPRERLPSSSLVEPSYERFAAARSCILQLRP